MRDTIAHPLRDEEIEAWLDKRLKEATERQSFGDMEPLIIQTIKHRLGEHRMLLESTRSVR